jgi:hypothetical protein
MLDISLGTDVPDQDRQHLPGQVSLRVASQKRQHWASHGQPPDLPTLPHHIGKIIIPEIQNQHDSESPFLSPPPVSNVSPVGTNPPITDAPPIGSDLPVKAVPLVRSYGLLGRLEMKDSANTSKLPINSQKNMSEETILNHSTALKLSQETTTATTHIDKSIKYWFIHDYTDGKDNVKSQSEIVSNLQPWPGLYDVVYTKHAPHQDETPIDNSAAVDASIHDSVAETNSAESVNVANKTVVTPDPIHSHPRQSDALDLLSDCQVTSVLLDKADTNTWTNTAQEENRRDYSDISTSQCVQVHSVPKYRPILPNINDCVNVSASVNTLSSYFISLWSVLLFYSSTCNRNKQSRPKDDQAAKSRGGAIYAIFILLPLLLLVPIQATQVTYNKDPVCVGDISVKDNFVKELEKYRHCRVIEGSLLISMYDVDLLKEDHKEEQIQNVSLPELIEITDHLLLYRANQIKDLSTLLPKLAVIRGNKLISNYAMVIYRNKNMQTVSLPNLTTIIRGGVRIEKNPLLCYVDTIDWQRIVISSNIIDIQENQELNVCSDTCPLACNNPPNCWNNEKCQKILVSCPKGTDEVGEKRCYKQGGKVNHPCDEQCLGGCKDKGETQEDCLSCKNMRLPLIKNPFACRAKCPSGFLSYKNWTCITKDECMNKTSCETNIDPTQKVQYKIIQDRPHMPDECVTDCPGGYEPRQQGRFSECVECQDCHKTCNGEHVNSVAKAVVLSGCTRIKGDLEIQVSKSRPSYDELENYLGKVKVIEGQLKIIRSFSLVSLHFFTSLEEIQGISSYPPSENLEESNYTIQVLQNENLQKLFPKDRNIRINGRAFFHYNPQLCRKEIDELIQNSGINDNYEDPIRKTQDISPVSNGDKAVCSERKLWLGSYSLGAQILVLTWQNYAEILHAHNDNIRSLLGYNVFHREITEAQFAAKNMTKYEGREACSSSETWQIINVRKMGSRVKSETRGNETENHGNGTFGIITYPEEHSFIPNLKPYTPYALYVTTLMIKSFTDETTKGAQSDIIYIRTMAENPDPVENLYLNSESYSSLLVSWEPPKRPNGIIDHYDIIVELLVLGDETRERNYCARDLKEATKKTKVEVKKDNNSSEECPKTDCPPCNAGQGTEVSEDKHIDEANLVDDIINEIFPATDGFSNGKCGGDHNRRKRFVEGNSAENILENDEDEPVEKNNNIVNQVTVQLPNKETGEKMLDNVTETNNATGIEYFSKMYVTVPGNKSVLSLTLNQLRHFGRYSIKVRACQAVYMEKIGNCTANCELFKKCSIETEMIEKTLAKPDADDIPSFDGHLQLEIHDGNDTNGRATYIRWRPPKVGLLHNCSIAQFGTV